MGFVKIIYESGKEGTRRRMPPAKPLPSCHFLFSAGNAEGGQRPEAEGYGPAEEDMVPHADDREGHDHEHAAKAHGLGEAVLSMAVIFQHRMPWAKKAPRNASPPGMPTSAGIFRYILWAWKMSTPSS